MLFPNQKFSSFNLSVIGVEKPLARWLRKIRGRKSEEIMREK